MSTRIDIFRAALALSAATFLSAALAQTPGSSTAGVQGGVGPGTPSSTAGNSTDRTAAGATGAGGSTAADRACSTAGSAGATRSQ